MKITNSFNNNFGALFGKRTIITSCREDATADSHTIQYVYPFKNEFKTEAQKKAWLEKAKDSNFYKSCNCETSRLRKTYEIVLQPELPYTKEIFIKAKQDGVDLTFVIPDFYAVTTIEKGYRPALMYDGDKFECFA